MFLDNYQVCDFCQCVPSYGASIKYCNGCAAEFCDRWHPEKVIKTKVSLYNDDEECIYCTKNPEMRTVTDEDRLKYLLEKLDMTMDEVDEEIVDKWRELHDGN